MRKLCLVLTVIFLLASACNVQNKGGNFVWKEFVSDEGKFKTEFPGVPISSVEEIEWGETKLPSYRFEVFSPMYLGVTYTNYPKPASASRDELKRIYDYQRDLMLKWTDSELISERDIWLGENLGREIVFKTETFLIFNNRISHSRFYSIGNRTYQLNTSFNAIFRDASAEQNANKFLDSFELIKK